MHLHLENILLIGSVLLMISILTSKTSYQFGIPTLILFLVVGMLAGSEGLGGIPFDNPKLAQMLGVIALNFILFSGGLDTKMESIRPILWRALSLSTIGMLVNTTLVGVFVQLITGLSLLEGLLLGAIVSATDSAAVFSILRSKNIGLKGHIRPTLELESGSNDPMGYILTITFTYLIVHGNASWLTVAGRFLQQMAVGALMGYVLGRIIIIVLNRIALNTEGLYPVLLMAFMFFTYSFTDFIGGNGFLAVYLSAIMLGNASFIHKKSLMQFYDGQAWLMQIIMFLTLGLLVYPSHILPIIGPGILISLFLILVARPVSVFASYVFFDASRREKIFLSWVGLRGAVPIIFAIIPITEKLEKADIIFHLVFFISVTSVLIQGTTLPRVAKWLRLIVPEKARKRTVLDLELSDAVRSELMEIVLPGYSRIIGKSIVQVKFPRSAFIVLLNRDSKYIQPNGSTILEEGDKLLVVANNKDTLREVYSSLDIKEEAGRV